MRLWRKKKELTLKEQRDNIRDAIKRAMSRGDFTDVFEWEKHLEDIEKKIRKKNV